MYNMYVWLVAAMMRKWSWLKGACFLSMFYGVFPLEAISKLSASQGERRHIIGARVRLFVTTLTCKHPSPLASSTSSPSLSLFSTNLQTLDLFNLNKIKAHLNITELVKFNIKCIQHSNHFCLRHRPNFKCSRTEH